jgi:DNA-binding CsgD family transcriptional regulator
MANGDAELMHRVGDRALELADRFAVQDVLVDVLISVGTMEMELEGGTDESRVKLERGIELARDSGLDELAGRAYTTLIYEAFNFCRLDLAERVIGEAISYAASRGLDMRLMCVLGLRAELELSRGDWDGAVEDASSVLGGVRSGLPRLDALVVLGLVRARRGDPDVWGPLDEALAIAKPTDSLWVIFPILAARAEAAWLAGSTETILAESEPFVRRALRAYDRWALPQLAYWRRQAGADEDLSDGDRSPRRLQLGGEAGRAAEEWAALGYPYEAALALADTGDPDDLRRAFAQLQALGATAAAAAVTRRARAGGAQNVPRGPRVSTSGNPAGLTDREVEVVALLAEGLRNAEVAARLFVSEKTVEHHVSAMFRKLGVRTRGQAVAEALRLGIVVSPAV